MIMPAAGPAARRLAREHGVDLRRVGGDGRRGRVTVDDVLRAASAVAAAPPPARGAPLPVTARADVSDLLDRLPALSAVSGQHEAPLTPLLIKAAAMALRGSPALAPLCIARGSERWALPDGDDVGSLGIASLTLAAAAARIDARGAEVAMPCGASLRLDGPVTDAAFRDGAIRARSRLDLMLEGPDEAAAAPFVHALVELLETPVLLLSA